MWAEIWPALCCSQHYLVAHEAERADGLQRCQEGWWDHFNLAAMQGHGKDGASAAHGFRHRLNGVTVK